MTFNWVLNRPIAHRGLHDDEVPENSLWAFEKARNAGFSIELDVRLGLDNELIVFHDEETSRLCSINKKIENSTLLELQPLRLKESDEMIPTLKNVLDLIKGEVPILVELKVLGRREEFIEALLKITNSYCGEIAFQSFDPFILRQLKKINSNLVTGYLSGHLYDTDLSLLKRFICKNILAFYYTKADFVGYESKYLNTFSVRILRRKGVPFLGWTIRSRKEQKEVEYLCSNIIFEGFIPSK